MAEIKSPVKIMQKMVRTHGFQCPLHPTQLFTFVLYGMDILSFYLINMVSLSHITPALVIMSIVYAILAIGTAYYAYLSTITNPEDPTIHLERQCRDKNIEFSTATYDYRCEICAAHVLAGTKHCGKCNRCTQGFDHHCQYLNNCIGKDNYPYFFKLIIWVFWLCLTHNVTNAFVVYDIVTEKSHIKQNHLQVYNIELSSQFYAILIAIMVLNSMALIFLIHLIAFHIELKHKGLTTFEYLRLKETLQTGQKRESKVILKVN